MPTPLLTSGRRSVLFLALLAGCAMPAFESSRKIDLTLPLTGIHALDCESHNGDIKVTGDAAATGFHIEATLTVRGMTQDEANANLRLLDIQHETVGDRLHLSAKIAPEMPSYAQPSVAWQVTGPVQLAVGLTSHNGGIVVQGTNGKLAMETHNGGIHAKATSAELAIATHNGDVDLDLAGGGALAGSIESHNGGIDVRIADGCSTAVEASTHNGRIKASRGEAKLNEDGNQATVRIGAGDGRLQVTTHNGDVTIR